MEWGEGEEEGGYAVDTYIPITLHQSPSKDYIKNGLLWPPFCFSIICGGERSKCRNGSKERLL